MCSNPNPSSTVNQCILIIWISLSCCFNIYRDRHSRDPNLSVAVTFHIELRPQVHAVLYRGNKQLSTTQLRTAGGLVAGNRLFEGVIVVALTLGVIEALVTGYVSSSLRDVAAFLLLIAVLYVRPNGLFGSYST